VAAVLTMDIFKFPTFYILGGVSKRKQRGIE